MRRFTAPGDCGCYKCVGQDIRYHNGHAYVHNDMEYHTFGQPCRTCGHARSEYKDLGRKGRFVCWWCRKRTAEPHGPPAENPGRVPIPPIEHPPTPHTTP